MGRGHRSSFICELIVPARIHKRKEAVYCVTLPSCLSQRLPILLTSGSLFPSCSLVPRSALITPHETIRHRYKAKLGTVAKSGSTSTKQLQSRYLACSPKPHSSACTSGMPAIELPITQRPSSDLCLSPRECHRQVTSWPVPELPLTRARGFLGQQGQVSRSCTLSGPLLQVLQQSSFFPLLSSLLCTSLRAVLQGKLQNSAHHSTRSTREEAVRCATTHRNGH